MLQRQAGELKGSQESLKGSREASRGSRKGLGDSLEGLRGSWGALELAGRALSVRQFVSLSVHWLVRYLFFSKKCKLLKNDRKKMEK